jgi:2-methylisocitrate lyase-like PEP mutase family enzyme
VGVAKAELLRSLHAGPELLVLPNAWDAASARVFAACGFPAIATGSAAVAEAHGYPDGEQIPRELMLCAVERIAGAVDVPVTADLEAGYGDPVGTARAAWEAGAVGMNFEDALRPPAAHAADVRAIKEAVPELVLNARTDVFLHAGGTLDDAIERLRAYRAAGADCTYPIVLDDLAAIERLVHEVGGPVNILVPAESPPLAALARVGVRRVSFGSGFFRASLARVEELARAVRPPA